jgi:hypothetical protein
METTLVKEVCDIPPSTTKASETDDWDFPLPTTQDAGKLLDIYFSVFPS